MAINTNFDQNGIDISTQLVTKDDYFRLIASLPSRFKISGLVGIGQNTTGQLANNTTVNKSSPMAISPGSSRWAGIAGRGGAAAGIKEDGTLWTWGNNTDGKLGLNLAGSTVRGGFPAASSPIQTADLGNNWTSIKIGGTHMAGIRGTGTMWAWGNNDFGQVGVNGALTTSSPIQVGTTTTWVSYDLGEDFTLGVKSNGSAWAWGNNDNGQLGQINRIGMLTPVQVGTALTWAKIFSGNKCSYGIKKDGTLWSWGLNNYGQLGQGHIVSKSSPTQVGTGADWLSVSGGMQNTAAIKTNGTLWVWGRNSEGALGTGNVINRSSPVQTISGGSNWAKVSCTDYGFLAIKTDGKLWGCGYNLYGLLDQGNIVAYSSPVQSLTVGNWIDIESGYSFALGLVDENT